MKYLKKYNEDLYQTDLQELEDFCNSHLSYLIDEDYHLRIQEVFFEDQNEEAFQIALITPKIVKQGFFSGYQEIGTPFENFKDRLLPFVHMLLKDYRLVTNEFISRTGLEKTGSMGFFLDIPPKEIDTGAYRLGSLEQLETFVNDKNIKSFYIRVQKK